MQDIYPDRVFSYRCQPFAVGIVAPLRKLSLLCVNAEIASREEYEHPGQQREVVGRIEEVVVHTKREQDTDIVCDLWNVEYCKSADADVTAADIHREDKQEHTDDDTDECRQLIEYLVAKSVQHHAYAEKMEDAEKDGAISEERENKCHYHADEEALHATLQVI